MMTTPLKEHKMGFLEIQMLLMKKMDDEIDAVCREMERDGVYMPSIATCLRLKADELAELYPDDSNKGAN